MLTNVLVLDAVRKLL